MASAACNFFCEFLDNKCANCWLFEWGQPDPSSIPLRRCTGCLKIYYCSKECQEEHWKKVHKRHCKFFSGEKRLDGTVVHNQETCSDCIKQMFAGKAVFKEKNPNYICMFDPSNPKAKSLLELQLKYPVPLRAGTGQDRVERIVDLLQRLLLKIKLTKQPVFRLLPREVEKIADELHNLKMRFFVWGVVYPRNYQVPVALDRLFTSLKDLRSVPPSGQFQMWQTFLKIVDMLAWTETIKLEAMIKKPKKSLTKEQMQVSDVVRGGSYLQVVDRILEVLEERLVSQKDLAAIVCDGNMQRICSGCNRDIVIQEVGVGRELALPRGGMPAVMFNPGKKLFSCRANACEEQLVSEQDVYSWVTAVIATATMLLPARCDNCFLMAPVKEVHRLEQILPL